MTSSNLPTQPASHDVERRLQDVLRCHQEISAAILRVASQLPRARRRSWQSLSKWFAQGPTPQQVLHRAEALAICLPLLTTAAGDELPNWEIDEAVRQAVDGDCSQRGQRYVLFQGLIYPCSVLLICTVILLCFCLFLVPEFDSMFQDFQLELPMLTHALILLSRFLRQWGGLLFGTMAVLILLLVWIGKRYFSHWMCSKRDAMGIWARHVSLLLRAGLSDEQAVHTAGQASKHGWVSQQSQYWASQLRQGQRPFDGPVYAGSQPVAMIGFAMRSATPQARSEWLDEVVKMYRERDRFRWHAWMAWSTPLVILATGGMIALFVIALFLPMLGLFHGLG